MGENHTDEGRPLGARSRPQYHYFYGSTEAADLADSDAGGNDQEHDSLIGEELVTTDHEEEMTPNSSERDLQHVLITNGNHTKPWFFQSPTSAHNNNTVTTNSNNGTDSNQRGTGGGMMNSYGLGRIIPIILLAIGISALLIAFLPRTSNTTPMSNGSYIPFDQVQRSEFGDPVDGFVDKSLFHPTLLSVESPKTFVFPFPTGAFWTNLVMRTTSSSSSESNSRISYPIVVYPYSYKWSNCFLQISYPGGHRHTDGINIVDSFTPELSITTKEDIANRYVTKFDPLSVTLRFVATQTSKWETALVQGSPYATIKYLNATPVFEPLTSFKSVQCPGDDDENFSDLIDNENETEFVEGGGKQRQRQRSLFGVCSIDLDPKKGKTYLRGVQFIFKTPEGVSWIMFASEPIILVYDAQSRLKIAATSQFTGVIRLACIPAKDAADTSVDSSTGLKRLIYHAGVYPVGGQVSWEFTNSKPSASSSSGGENKVTSTGKYATVHLSYATQSMTDNNLRPNSPANTLLMLSLPHHATMLPKTSRLNYKHFDLSYRCIKGPLTPVLGSTWSFDEPLPTLDFDGPRSDIDQSVAQTILEQVEEDFEIVLPSVNGDIYGFGKQIARLAQLVHISSRLQRPTNSNVTTPDKASELLAKSSELLKGYLERLFSDQVVDGLVFDSNLGGLVSKNGLMDNRADFGNGRYNGEHSHIFVNSHRGGNIILALTNLLCYDLWNTDHHFHYG